MNFDELKDAWANEPVEGPSVPTKLKSTTGNAIYRLRKNMKTEFSWTLIGLGLTLIFMFRQGHFSNLTFCAAFMLFAQSGYFFTRFFLFYKRSGRYDIGLKKNIRQFVYELEINMEVYRTYSICVTPLACLAWIGLLGGEHSSYIRQYFNADISTNPEKLISMLAVLVALQVFGAVMLQLHQKTQYNRYLKELKSVVSEFED